MALLLAGGSRRATVESLTGRNKNAKTRGDRSPEIPTPSVAHPHLARPAQVLLVARRATELTRVAESIPSRAASIYPADLGSAAEVARVAGRIEAEVGTPDKRQLHRLPTRVAAE